MRLDDRSEFAGLLSQALGFYGQDVTEFALGVWWEACQSFDLEQVSKALTAHAMDPERGHFAPKPSDLVRALQGTHTDRSLVAWGKAYGAIGSVGAYESVVFDDPAIHAAVQDIGGWPTFCRSTIAELPYLQRRFCETHRAYARIKLSSYPRVLVGLCETANRADGKPAAPPMLVGDSAACQRVIEGGATGPTLPVARAVSSIGFEPRRVA